MADKRPRMYRPRPVSELLRGVFAGTPAEKRLREGRIWLVWEKAVGSRIAAHASPATFREGTLTINVDSAPWMQQLTFLKPQLIAKVNAELGEELVVDIYMKAGRVLPPQPAPKPWSAKRRPLTEEERSWISEQSHTVEDPELRAVFENLIRKDRENR